MITRLDASSARQLSAGQVITDLASVLKELLENALDAKSESVTVRLHNYGMDKIVVEDDGSGIPMPGVVHPSQDELLPTASTPLLCSRATTKQRDDTTPTTASIIGRNSGDGLLTVGAASKDDTSKKEGNDDEDADNNDNGDASLGFRGEALHSLAHVSDTVVETMHATHSPRTVRVTYDKAAHKTHLQLLKSRQTMGTMVSVERLFADLPVRHKEWMKNRRKQLVRATHVVKQYAVSHPHVRLVMSHQENSQSALVTLVALTGSNDLVRSVTESYGGMCVNSMSRVQWTCTYCELEGLVSKVGSGGRMSADHQVFALDGRLVDLPKLAKSINSAFTECLPNASQRLCVSFFLRIKMNREAVAYDVNLNPNKRKVLMVGEEKLAEELYSKALQDFRSASEGIEMDRNTRIAQTRASDNKASELTRSVLTPVSATAIAQFTYKGGGGGGDAVVAAAGSYKRGRDDGGSGGDDKMVEERARAPLLNLTKIGAFLYSDAEESGSVKSRRSGRKGPGGEQMERDDDEEEEEALLLDTTESEEDEEKEDEEAPADGAHNNNDNDAAAAEGVSSTPPDQPTLSEECLTILSDEGNRRRAEGASISTQFPSFENLLATGGALFPPCCHDCSNSAADSRNKSAGTTRDKQESSGYLKGQTDKQLANYFHKRSFTEMTILGQFNHGFIIASLGEDLFVIDQHASDEKYNYERLMQLYVPKPQPLVVPVSVAMDTYEVDLAVEHAEKLLTHGFTVKRNEQDPTKLLVHTIPILPYDVVSATDVLELVQQLVRYGTITKGLRAVWHSMATKACRSSIMIGTALSDATMRTVVDRLSGLDQPWTCPHGRPTLRHLCNKAELKQSTPMIIHKAFISN